MSKKKFLVIMLLFLCGYAEQQSVRANNYSELRIVSLSPEVTEILFALGLKDNIVGVTTYCNYPPEAKSIEKVGTFSSPNIEKIISLRPTIVFATGLEQSVLADKLRNLNINIYVSYPSSIESLFESIQNIGALTNRQKEADLLVKNMSDKIESISREVKSLDEKSKPKVFVQLWDFPLITVGNKSFIDELITLAGGINVTHDINRAYSYVNLELIAKRNPDCIIMAYMDKPVDIQNLKNAVGYRSIDAVKNNRVFADINPDLFLRTGPRITEGLEEIFKRIHGLN